jgi:hypothetical protein
LQAKTTHPAMRLTPAQIDTIKSTAQAVLGEGAQVWLYGSRLDDQRKGGDLDIQLKNVYQSGAFNASR